ncbi:MULTISPECIES: phosphotransferase [Streptomyces]|uniref:Aminoglycoside phosphotransferase n=1 Tax=Streptomyces tsukubensis (strain DSM 42081 / NBRC 108919 / NRRL 18488 / 9993) TaxID=1114943 RepID=A0A7G3U9N0_STRT9|nr:MULTISPECIES: phosphotransferase [Streptomyces]AZK97830.1 aminoglycoside phosphotransferase [Streptomyces tsukubensis]MYS67730.1 phosphotransferase [Streptomyces sp. SID5473]QKM66241.1 aminoglycoside phosphotransferase [Streptomyces tsukubensis NRRL18488]TAI45421.1 aminoglycoside phosphotransferase family protein [Streptomyces tsukubensis]
MSSHPGSRAEHALALAVEAGRELGLRADRPRVLHDVFSVLVHLAPEPVVVRVPALAVGTAAELRERQQRELAVTGWLADTGFPVVGPSPLVPREPVGAGGTSLTFWEYVTEIEPLRDLLQGDPGTLTDRFTEQTGWTAELHAALAHYPGELPVLSPLVPAIGLALAELRSEPQALTPADLDRADREYTVLEALVAEFPARFPQARLQSLHGDSPAYNLLRTADGHRFADFEDVTVGPVEWDLTFTGPRAIEVYERASGTRVDRTLLDLMEGARLLQGLSALTVVPKVPELGPMLAPLIDQWRARKPLELHHRKSS